MRAERGCANLVEGALELAWRRRQTARELAELQVRRVLGVDNRGRLVEQALAAAGCRRALHAIARIASIVAR